MKKLVSLLACVLAVGCFAGAGCGQDPKPEGPKKVTVEFDGGSEANQKKITNALNASIVQINSADTMLPVGFAQGSYDLVGDKGDYIMVATTQVGVKLEWQFDETNPILRRVTQVDEAHKLIELNYPDENGADTTFEFKLVGASVGTGDAKASLKEGTSLTYKANVQHETLHYDHMHLAELLKMKDTDPDKFNIIDYETKPESPYFYHNNEGEKREYWYVETYGEVLYFAPDGNWGLLAEGDDVIEFYAGSAARNFSTKNYPALEVGNKVLMKGDMSQYMGNIQLGYITDIDYLPTGVTCADANKTFNEITETDIEGFIVPESNPIRHKQNIHRYMNSLRKVQGSYIAGSLKNSANADIKGARFYFEVKVGDQKIQIAYDYHTTRNATPEVEALVAELNSVINNPNKTFEIKGTLRYSGSDSASFIGDKGVWSLVPYLNGQITEVE